MIGYAKFFDNAKTMSPKVNDKKLLRNYIKILVVKVVQMQILE